MKKILSLTLAMLLALGLAACGGGNDAATDPPETAAPATEAVTETVPPTTEPAAEPTGSGTSLLDTARTFEGAPVEDLIAAIGEPESSDYAPSCLGEGEDGNLYYDGFTVYTYRDTDGTETVNYVE